MPLSRGLRATDLGRKDLTKINTQASNACSPPKLTVSIFSEHHTGSLPGVTETQTKFEAGDLIVLHLWLEGGRVSTVLNQRLRK
jgi:hypothetical protein